MSRIMILIPAYNAAEFLDSVVSRCLDKDAGNAAGKNGEGGGAGRRNSRLPSL